MNRIWDIPPPPGTEDFELEKSELEKPKLETIKLEKSNLETTELEKSNLEISELEKSEPAKDIPQDKFQEKSTGKEITVLERPIDRINPYLKNPEYIEYEKRRLERRRRSRSRSYSRDRYHRHRYSKSRSRSRSRRRRKRYTSRSRSRSSSYRRHKRSRRRSRSRSGSRSKSASKSRQSSKRSRRSHTPPSKRSPSQEKPVIPDVDTSEVDMKIEEDEDLNKDNVFKNDGTFLEMFKKMQEQQKKVKEEPEAPVGSKKVLPVFGKRRGGKVLKTGLVKKLKQQNEEENNSEDAWSMYMKEVRKYKEACCDDDSKTRPLVK